MPEAGEGPQALSSEDKRFIGAVLGCAALLQVWIAWSDQGLFWPDEIFQTLEQGHRAAFGYGLIPWEFRLGARSWLFPGALAVLIKVASLVGLDSVRAPVLVARTAMAGVTVLGLWASMLLARRLGGRTALWIAGLVSATFPLTLLFGARCMSELASGTLIAVAALLALGTSRRALIGAGVLAGLAVFARYQTGVLALGLLVEMAFWRWRAKSWTPLGWFLAGLAAATAAGALLDWATWGKPFHSLIEYVDFNLVQGRASQWGREPAMFYVSMLWTVSPLVPLLLIAGLATAPARARGLALVAFAFVVAHSLVPHKELRFILPVVPLAFAVAATGLGTLFERHLTHWWGVGLAAICALVFLWRAPQLTFGELGQFQDSEKRQLSAWKYGNDLNRGLWAAGARADLCGLVFHDIRHWSGGYSYLHREVPTLWGLNNANARACNYVITHQASPPPPPYALVESIGEYALYRRDGPCAPNPPGFTWNMPGP